MINHGIPLGICSDKGKVCQGYYPWIEVREIGSIHLSLGLWFSQNCLLSVIQPRNKAFEFRAYEKPYCQSTIGVVPWGV